MELAVNNFQGGLMLDTHPMAVGNKTLTDCLNGTLVTMSGNEMVLLNDMGNRRIDNAFLPSGYEPVGIKEYGGVIYIAAYNPITNHSQIGSFPSPERKIDVNDELPLKDFDFDKFSSCDNVEEEDKSFQDGFNVLKNDSFLTLLTDDNTLHVGDKFVVYCDKLSTIKNDISNYDNILGDKVKSPKNKKYTIQLGILDNQNVFHDISDYLMRWDSSNKIIRNLEEKSDLYRKNIGYFIPDEFVSGKDIDRETITDTNLIRARKREAANTFSYKLAGPLYMKVTYNHILNFACNVAGKILSNNDIELTFTGYFTYNCPDINKNSQSQPTYLADSDSDYVSFERLGAGTDDLLSLDFDVINTNNPFITIGNPTTKYSEVTYDKTSNLYNVVLTKTYTFTKPSESNFEYIIGVKSGLTADCSDDGITNPTPIYLKGLSSKGSLDLSRLNSGELTLTLYRFYNDTSIDTTTEEPKRDTSMILTFEAYPKENEKFENLRLKFTNILFPEIDNEKYLFTHLPIMNGQQLLNFNWKDSILEKDDDNNYNPSYLKDRATYKVEILYDKVTTNNDGTTSTETITYEENIFSEAIKSKAIEIELQLKTEIKNYILDLVDDEDMPQVYADEIKTIIDSAIKYNKRFFYDSSQLSSEAKSEYTLNISNHVFDYEFIDIAPLDNSIYLFKDEEKLLKDLFLFLSGDESLLEETNVVNNIHEKFETLNDLYKFYGQLFYVQNYLYYKNDEYANIISNLTTYNGNPLLKINSIEQFKSKIFVAGNYLDIYFYEFFYGRWFLTTELFNDCYLSELIDFCNPEYTNDNELFLEKLIVRPYVDVNNVKVTYGDIESYIERNGVDVKAIYAINLNENILKLKQDVTAKIDSATLHIDEEPYPDYIDFPSLITCNPEEVTTTVKEEIEGDSYEQLSVIYYPVSDGGYKDLVGDTYIGILVKGEYAEHHTGIATATYTGVDPNGIPDNALNKDSHDWKWNPNSNWIERYNNSTHVWDISYGEGSHTWLRQGDYGCPTGGVPNPYQIAIECISGDSNVLNLSLTKVYLRGNDHGLTKSIPFYIVKHTNSYLSIIIFGTSNNPQDLPQENFDVIISDKKENPDLFKIVKQTIPDIRTISDDFEVHCEFSQTSNDNIPIIGNLTFNVSFEDKTLTVEYEYHNKQLIEYYMKYLHKTNDKYININSGNISSIVDYRDFFHSNLFTYNSNGQLILKTYSPVNRYEVAHAGGWERDSHLEVDVQFIYE